MLTTIVVPGLQINYGDFSPLYFEHDGAVLHYERVVRDYVGAVSYTHLDVYKRQLCEFKSIFDIKLL